MQGQQKRVNCRSQSMKTKHKKCFIRCHIIFVYVLILYLTELYNHATVESRFYEPPRETKSGSKNRRVREIGGKITVFD